jgi:hypothetical protein
LLLLLAGLFSSQARMRKPFRELHSLRAGLQCPPAGELPASGTLRGGKATPKTPTSSMPWHGLSAKENILTL